MVRFDGTRVDQRVERRKARHSSIPRRIDGKWKLPGSDPHAYAMFVDEKDMVWLSESSANALVRFDPRTGQFQTFALLRPHANARQMMVRPGEVWLSESGTDHLLRYRSLPTISRN
jgi:virginiamycin B lyase